MPFVDWLIVIAYCLILVVIGASFFRRSGRNSASFFVADRRLPWWKIGFSSAASYTGAAAAPLFTMLVFRYGISGNWWWWLSFCLWMPLVAALWAKYWRRLGIATPAGFMEVRFRGREARFFRGVYAVYMGLGWATILNGYASGMFLRAVEPILGPSTTILFFLAVGVLLVLCTVPGLGGIAFTDVIQFLVFVAANGLLAFVIIRGAGGLGPILALAREQRGEAFFHVLPPTGDLAGMTIVFLFIQGLFFASSPAGGEGYTAQRFIAARDESHAQAGQMLSAVLTLVVRVAPFIALGIVGAALLPSAGTEPEKVWGLIVSKFAAPGLMGLIMAGQMAAFLSTVDSQVNWGGSFLVHDLYRPRARAGAPVGHEALVARLVSAGILLLGAGVGYFLIDSVMAWFLFINSVAVAFILPLSWLRFFWWRHNIRGEAAALFIGLPLSFLVWFPLGFADPSRHPFWHGFLLLFGLGWMTIVAVDLVTPPEDIEKLRKFYSLCRPPGFWGPVARSLNPGERKRVRRENERDLWEGILGTVFCFASVSALTAAFGRRTVPLAVALSACLGSGLALFLRLKKRGFFRNP
ncbi:MAG: sodium:solute symporter family transporter [Candidatus Aminicenantales bacterium]